MIKWNVAIGLLAGALCVQAQTWQGFQLGDSVRVVCSQPRLLLGRATLTGIEYSNIVVHSSSGDFRLPKNLVTLEKSDPAKAAPGTVVRPSAVMPTGTRPADPPPTLPKPKSSVAPVTLPVPKASASAPVSLSPAEAESVAALSAQVQQAILGPYAADPGHAGAVQRYQSAVRGVMEGTITAADLRRQAEAILAECDRFAPERQAMPQYEAHISYLRQFSERAGGGEQITFSNPPK